MMHVSFTRNIFYKEFMTQKKELAKLINIKFLVENGLPFHYKCIEKIKNRLKKILRNSRLRFLGNPPFNCCARTSL